MRPDSLPPFRPLRSIAGYLPIEDHGLIGDGSTAALVGRDGAVVWLCVPRFDARPLFCRILDARRGGAFTVAPEDVVESRQYYEPDTAVLVTELRTPTGLVRLTDALLLREGADLSEGVAAARGELLRVVQVLSGTVRLQIAIEPWGGADIVGGPVSFQVCPLELPDLQLRLLSTQPLDGPRTVLDLEAGDCLELILDWSGLPNGVETCSAGERLNATREVWIRWISGIVYDGPQAALVRRSAITLKLLNYLESGAIVAAPTSSLPEAIGGPRNWDYRYTWIRDASYTVYALHRLQLFPEAAGFLSSVLDVADRHGRPPVLYDLDGNQPPPEREDPELEGYRGSRPVRWGNAAADQVQHDVYGEIVDVAFQWSSRHGSIDPILWNRLLRLVEAAAEKWHLPDRGIWEVRTSARPFTYSAAICQVALDRAVRLARRYRLPGNVDRWNAVADQIVETILRDAWDPEIQSLVQHIGGGGLDASLLALPLRRVIPFDHPKMIATVDAIRQRLEADGGLLYRYIPEHSPDGIAGDEGAFVLCSFWLVDNLAGQGRIQEALDLYNSLCARAGPLGLLAEEIDPATGAFLGNFPQAFSHVGLISSGINIALAAARERISGVSEW